MKEIIHWLNSSRDYKEGVQLYLQHGTNPVLKKVFGEGQNEFKAKKLYEALLQLVAEDVNSPKKPQESETLDTKIADSQEVVQPVKPQESPKAVIKELRKGWPSVMDETVSALHGEWLQLFSEKKNLQSRIYEIAKAGQQDEAKHREAGAMAHRILDLRDACNTIYSRRDYCLQHGHLPETTKPLELPANPLQYPKALANYERYVRDYKAQLTKNPAHKTAHQQIEKYQWGINQLKKLMGINDAV